MEAARGLFQSLKDGGYAGIMRLKEDEYPEGIFIDFKTLQANEAPMRTDDKKTYAEAVSGFSNSEGGVIVWGVWAAKVDGVDRVQDFRPIGNLRKFLSDLNTLLPQLIAPGGMAVEHELILEPGQDDRGFVVTFVPKWDGEPQMARAQGQHRYYYRSGDSFLAMEPFMLADRYSRRPRPKLRLVHRYEPGGSGGKTNMVIGIENVGLGVALYPGLKIEDREWDVNCQIRPLNPNANQFTRDSGFGLREWVRTPRRPSEQWRMFAGGADDAIYPGTNMDILLISFQIPQAANIAPFEVALRYSLYCDGFSLVDQTKVIPGEEVIKAARNPNFQPPNDE